MIFIKILYELLNGKKIKRSCWENNHYWIINSKDQLVNSIGENPIISQKQLEANDWIVYDEELKESPSAEAQVLRTSAEAQVLRTSAEAQVLRTKPMVIILDDNPVSIACYAQNYPENWRKICEALEKK